MLDFYIMIKNQYKKRRIQYLFCTLRLLFFTIYFPGEFRFFIS